ncbi:MAG: hypothetical protein IJP14_00430 [Clostridia bacterium]|nr:hypothetical protein [Clostridia bacterium]
MKIRVRDILWAIVALLALIAGGMTLFSNIGVDDTPADKQVMIWYLSLHSLLFMVMALLAILERLFPSKAGALKTVLYGGNVLFAGAYTLLVIIDASPIISEFIAKELWRSPLSIMTLSTYIIYIGIGLLVIGLCFNKLRGQLENQRSLGFLLMLFAVLSSIPTVIFSFQYNISASLHATTITYMLLMTVLQAFPVYTLFCAKADKE